MDEDRRELDRRVACSQAIEKVTADLRLEGAGTHFFCPGCQPRAEGRPEMVVREGHFQCFRCGARGDVVGLVKLARQCDHETAMEWLARETNPAVFSRE